MRRLVTGLRWRYERHPVSALMMCLQVVLTIVIVLVNLLLLKMPTWAYFAALWFAAIIGAAGGPLFYDKLLREQNPLLPCRNCGSKPQAARMQLDRGDGQPMTFRVVGVDPAPDLCPDCWENRGVRDLIKAKKRTMRKR